MYKNKELVLGGDKVRCVGGLVVEKDFQLAQNITLSTVNAEQTNSGNLNVTGTSTTENLTVNEDLTVTGNAFVDGVLTVDDLQVNNAIIQPDLNVNINNLGVAGTLSSNTLNTNLANVYGNLDTFSVSATNGILTSALQVNGPTEVQGTITGDNILYLRKNEEIGPPVTDPMGSIGSRIVYQAGLGDVPYGVGVDLDNLYTTVPTSAKHSFLTGMNTKLTIENSGVTADDLTVTGDVSVDGETSTNTLSVTGNASVSGDLTVNGQLNVALQLPVHVLEDYTSRAKTGDVWENPYDYTLRLQTKQTLISAVSGTNFKIHETGTYAIYCAAYFRRIDLLTEAFVALYKGGVEIGAAQAAAGPYYDNARPVLIDIFNFNANDEIQFRMLARSSIAALAYDRSKAVLGVIKLA